MFKAEKHRNKGFRQAFLIFREDWIGLFVATDKI